jgi:PHP family Zn ribbon phosphoesterase
MKKIKADLHIHSALSACGSLEMSPKVIVAKAKEIGLDLIAITDHHAVENALHAIPLGKEQGVLVLAGLEVQTAEEVHVLCLFSAGENARAFHQAIYPYLPDIKNNPDFFGDQPIVDRDDNIIGFEEKLLLNSLELGLAEICRLAEEFCGTLIPAHVEADRFGLMKNLGLVPMELQHSIFEISSASAPAKAIRLYPQLAQHPLITNSDAHYPDSIGKAYTIYRTSDCSLAGIIQAALTGRIELYSEFF